LNDPDKQHNDNGDQNTAPYDKGEADNLILNIDGFEGPLDILLTLARSQKVDLKQISILQLVEQYLSFIKQARHLRLELAADYLVMAAWLAFLKSLLLLPEDNNSEEPNAEELAARLTFQLQRLEAIRNAAATLMSSDQLGRDFFVRGAPETTKINKTFTYELSLYEIMKAYADHSARMAVGEVNLERRPVYTIEKAIERLERLVGSAIDWTALESFLPHFPEDQALQKSARASIFSATLELAKQGKVNLVQKQTFGPVFLKIKKGDHNGAV